MFKALIGDLFASETQTLVNTVNCVGVMGKGVASGFKQRFPALFEDYRERCERNEVTLGMPYVYHGAGTKLVLNFPTKDHWRSPSRLADIEAGLDYFVKHYADWGITSIAFPPLGCGNGGLDWTEVGPLVYSKLHQLPIAVELYAPYGTPRNELTKEFFLSPAQMTLEGKGRKYEKLNPEWIVLIEVLRGLEGEPYANPVGRTIFQKICYVLTEMGVQTGFQFDKGSYGPFATEVKLALHEFANRNWLHEEQLGRMTSLRVGPQFEKDRVQFSEVFQRHEKRIFKTVDLFSRIKNTAQAEEVFTVFFASRQLKKAHPKREITERDLYDYIIQWKKSWATEEKKHAVADAIRNLVVLGWMKLRFSETMVHPA